MEGKKREKKKKKKRKEKKRKEKKKKKRKKKKAEGNKTGERTSDELIVLIFRESKTFTTSMMAFERTQ